MHINGFQVQEHGSGYQLTISLHVGKEEGDILSHLAELQSALAAVLVGGEPEKEPKKEKAPAKAEAPPKNEVEGKPAKGSRRRTRKAASEPSPDDAPKTRRRRSKKSTEDEPAKAAEPDPKAPVTAVKDEDILKACSQAAEAVGVEKVMELLSEFKVTKVNQLDDVARGEFYSAVKELAE